MSRSRLYVSVTPRDSFPYSINPHPVNPPVPTSIFLTPNGAETPVGLTSTPHLPLQVIDLCLRRVLAQ
jgi:hypothetical protein